MLTLVASLVLLLGAMPGATSAQTDPGGGGGGGGTGSGDLYGDLYVVLRDAQGLPLLNTDSCIQPITTTAFDGAEQAVNGDGSTVYLIPLLGSAATADPTVPEEEEADPCDVDPAFADLTIEVEFGRLNMGRSPEDTIARRYAEAIANLSTGVLGLDSAGRLTSDGVAIDAPAENLGIFLELHLYGQLTATTGGELVLPTPPIESFEYGSLHHAGAAIGAARDKYLPITMDLLVYNNRILGLPDDTTLGTVLVGDGVHGVLGETYFDYSDFTYDRRSTYPGRAFIYDYAANPWSPPLIEVRLMDFVFGGEDYTGTGAYAFATRADDARRVIGFVHDYFPGIVDPIVDHVGEDLVTPPPVVYPPTAVTALPGDGEVTVSWTAPTEGPAPTEYTVSAYPGGATCTTAGTSCVVTGLVNGTLYTFTVRALTADGYSPPSAPSAAVRPVPPVFPTGGFVDVPPGTYYTAPVDWASLFGITTGVGESNRFEPMLTVTRADFVTFMWRMMDEPGGRPPSGFVDLVPGAYYTEAIDWAKAEGITTGVGGTWYFRPNDPVTRAQAVTFMHRMSGLASGAPMTTLTDVERQAFYASAVDWATAHGITTGVGATGLFMPDLATSRAEAVTFLYRLASAPAAWAVTPPTTVLF